MKWMPKRGLILAALVLLTFFSNFSSHAQTEPSYKGKHIKIVVGFTAGGIIDLCARLYTQYMGKYIPGNPDLLVVFRRKGA